MDINTIGIILCIIIIIAVFIQIIRNRKQIIRQKDALTSQTINLNVSTGSTGSTGSVEQSTHSIWFYVKDWVGNYGIEKCIYKRASSENVFGDLNVSLGATNSVLIIKVQTIGSYDYIANYGSYYYGDYPTCSTAALSSNSKGCTGSTATFPLNYRQYVQTECNNQPGCNYYSYIKGNYNINYQLIGSSGSTAKTSGSGSSYLASTKEWTPGYYSTPYPPCAGYIGNTGCTGITSGTEGMLLGYTALCTPLGGCSGYSFTQTAVTSNPLTYTLLYDNNGVTMDSDTNSGYGYKDGSYTTCIIPDIELQRWINLVISISTNTMDVYINGELVQSQLLNNIANINGNTVYISPNGKGFNGMNSKFQYWPYYMNPRQVKNVYREGNGEPSEEDTRLNITLYKGDEKRANIII